MLRYDVRNALHNWGECIIHVDKCYMYMDTSIENGLEIRLKIMWLQQYYYGVLITQKHIQTGSVKKN